ncbi:hypothetical protein BDW75DRAFT_197412 [Aspergillus navahoensis]
MDLLSGLSFGNRNCAAVRPPVSTLFSPVTNIRSLQMATRLALYLVLLLTTGTRTGQGSNGLGQPVVRAGEG